MNPFYHALILIAAGVPGIFFGLHSLAQTLKTGKTRLRGGRTITRTRNPWTFRASVAGLCMFILLMLYILFIAASDLKFIRTE
jgi:hypothetical protein